VVSVKPLTAPTWLWAVVLAGGEGVRLRPLPCHVSGDDRPKQYGALLGARTLVEPTFDRFARPGPPDRNMIVETPQPGWVEGRNLVVDVRGAAARSCPGWVGAPPRPQLGHG
jgi:hypothetical protein